MQVASRFLEAHEEQIYSQHGEDGIIAWLIQQLDPMRFFVEFGVEDGQECNTRALAARGWRGLQIEARDDCWFDLMRLNGQHRQRVHSVHETLTLDNIGRVFAGVPTGFGLVSIDVDGNDIYFAEHIGSIYKPTIIVVEVNQHKPADKPYQQPYDKYRVWDGVSEEYGASLYSMTVALRDLGYVLLGTTSEGVNAFFVPEKEAKQLAFRV